MKKFFRRNRSLVATVATIAMVLLVSAPSSTLMMFAAQEPVSELPYMQNVQISPDGSKLPTTEPGNRWAGAIHGYGWRLTAWNIDALERGEPAF